MDLDQFPLSTFEVDCDGSACSSTSVGRHIHPPHLAWYETEAIGRVRIVNGERVGYGPAEGIDRLVLVAS